MIRVVTPIGGFVEGQCVCVPTKSHGEYRVESMTVEDISGKLVTKEYNMISDEDCEGGQSTLASWVCYQERKFIYGGKTLVGRSSLKEGQGHLSLCAYVVVVVDPNDNYEFKYYKLSPQSNGKPDVVKYIPVEMTNSWKSLNGGMPFHRYALILYGGPDNRSVKDGPFNLNNVVAEHLVEGDKSIMGLRTGHFITSHDNIEKYKDIARTLRNSE